MENVFNRALYKKIKKMDRTEMEECVKKFYNDGYNAGVNSVQNDDFEVGLLRLLSDVKGIGPKTKEKILEAYRENYEG